MQKMVHEKQFWDEYYTKGMTPWDAGKATRPLTTYIDQLDNKDLKILIPGAGNAHEAVYLWNKGFKAVYVLDISPYPLENLRKRVPEFPEEQLLLMDFFDLEETFDLILEQTFFCALHPSLRNDYAAHCAKLLHEEGKLVGVLFDDVLNTDRPPYGGTKEIYLNLLSTALTVKKMELCYNSIPPRQGRELFFQCTR